MKLYSELFSKTETIPRVKPISQFSLERIKMQYPKEVLNIVKKCEKKHSDIKKAYKCAESEIRALPGFSKFVDLLIQRAVQALIGDARHHTNVAMKDEAKVYGGPGKVLIGKSKGVQKTETDLFAYRIAGTELGRLKGENLEEIAVGEEERASGYMFNSRLIRGCRKHTPDGKEIRQSMSISQMYRVWRKAEEVGGGRKK